MSDFIEFLPEVFQQFGPINTRKMFGGYGVYHDGLMFGLVADDTLYLKADTISQEAFEAENLHRFEYEKNGKKFSMSYYLAPEAIYDDPETAAEWANTAYEAALRANSKKTKKRPS